MKQFILTSVIAAIVCLPVALLANTISAPTQIYHSVDWTSAGVGGVRDKSPATANIVLSGVSGTVSQALLFWHGPTYSTDPNVNASIVFNGTPIVGANIGFSSDNCWGYNNSQAYRADVTALVTGNGTYSVSGFIKPAANINGFSLIVFYDDGNPSNNRDVILYQGNDSNISNPYDALGWNVTLPGIDYTSGAAYLQLHVSDGQSFPDAPLVLNGLVLDAGPDIFQGTTVPDAGTASTHNGGLWDIETWDITSWLTPFPPTDTLSLTSGQLSDCLSLIVAVVDLPAGAAPTPPTATITRVMNSLTATTKYYSLTATSPLYPSSELELYVADTSSATVRGPYASSSIIQFKQGAVNSASLGRGLVKAIVTTVGSAEVYAIDPGGNLSPLVEVP